MSKSTLLTASIEKDQKVVVFSDSHITHHFNKKKNKLLHEIIASADIIIINGDFWDGYVSTAQQILASPWSALLDKLKEKQTFYLCGNHDKYRDSQPIADRCANEFGEELLLQVGTTTYHIKHGQDVYPDFDDRHKRITQLSKRLTRYVSQLSNIKNNLKSFLPHIKPNPLRVMLKRQLAKQPSCQQHFHIFGHSHRPLIQTELQCANSGFVTNQIAFFLEIGDKIVTQKTTQK